MTTSQKLKQFWHGLEKKFIPPDVWEKDLLAVWRERIVFAIFFSAAVIGPFALIPSLILSAHEKLWGVFILDAAAYIIVLFTLFYPGLLLKHKTWIAFLIFYGLGTGLLFMIGFYGAGYIWLFGASLIVGGMIGFKAAGITLVLNLISLISIGVYIAFGAPEWAGEADNAVEKWLVMTVNFMLINTLVTLTVAAMLTSLKNALEREHRMTSELEKRRLELMAIFRASPDPVIVYDNHNQVQYINDAFTAVFGWDTDDLREHEIFFVPEGAKPMPGDRAINKTDGIHDAPIRFETKRSAKGGRILDVSLSAALMKDIDQNVVGMVVNLKDITETKKMETQLQHALKMEAIGTLAGGIAHDFNNILQAITGFAQLLIFSKSTEDPDFSDLNEIIKASERASTLIRQLMLFSRKVEPEKRQMSLNQVIRDTVKILERTIPRMVTISLNLGSPLWHVRCDPVQIEQMLLNLGSNAALAITHNGQITIETRNIYLDHEYIQNHTQPVCGQYVVLSVADTGRGIAPEDMDHIFEPFFTSREIGKGTGLGLSSVYGIVKGHEGFINCTSHVNQGTEFRIFLPAGSSEMPAALTMSKVTKAVSSGNYEVILVVDDDIQVQKVVCGILTRNNYNVMTASSGEEALEVFQTHRNLIDLVVLDIGMPGMGGYQCLEAFRQIDKDIRVLIASGYSDEGPLQNALEKGASGYIGKPYHMKDFLHKIREMISLNEP